MMTNRTKAIVSLAGVFLLGAVCGALALGLFVRGRVHEAQRMRDRNGFQAFFVDRLRLSESQRDSLKDELARTYEELAELRRNTAVKYDAVLDSFKLRVKPILTAEQQTILEQEEKRLRRILPRDGRREGPGRGFRAAPPAGMPPGPPPESLPPLDSQGVAPKDAAKAERRRRLSSLLQSGEPAAGESGFLAQSTMLKRFHDRLNLSKEQTTSVKSAMTTMMQNMRRDRDEFAGMPRMQIGAIKKNLREFDASVSAILRPDQMEEYKMIRMELRDSIRVHMGRRVGPRPDAKAE